jgi:hypothetical protein
MQVLIAFPTVAIGGAVLLKLALSFGVPGLLLLVGATMFFLSR